MAFKLDWSQLTKKGLTMLTIASSYKYRSLSAAPSVGHYPPEQGCLAQLDGVSFHYPREQRQALTDVSLSVMCGEHLVLLGASGSGKSTLLQVLARLLPPVEGRVRIAARVGLVLQNAAAQIVGATVEEDVAFGPLNLGLPTPEVAGRVSESLASVRAEHLHHRRPAELSRGELQRVATAGVLAMHPSLLLLDEPAAFLDNSDAAWLQQLITALCSQGVAVIQATHSLAACRYANRVALLHQGYLVACGTPTEVLSNRSVLLESGLLAPHLLRKDDRTKRGDDSSHTMPILQLRPPLVPSPLDLGPGNALAVIGGSGSGKSKFALSLAGLNPDATHLKHKTKHYAHGDQGQSRSVGVLFQEPEQYFWADTVQEELVACGLPTESVAKLLVDLDLPEFYAYKRPTDLSAGEQRRVALAVALAGNPSILVADEPTAGLDIPTRSRVVAMLRHWVATGGCLIFVTRVRQHLYTLATHCVFMEEGDAVFAGRAATVLSEPTLLAKAGLVSKPQVPSRPEVDSLPPKADPTSLLHSLDPRTKLLLLLLSLTVLFTSRPAGTAWLALWLLLTWSATGHSLRLRELIPRSALLLAFFSLMTHALWTPGPYVFQWSLIRLSGHGMARGGILAARLLIMAMAAKLLTFSTSPLALSDALRWLLKPLERLGLRLPDLPMLLSIGARFVPELQVGAKRLATLRRLRERGRGQRSFVRELTISGKELLIPLVRMSLHQAATLGDALALRGYAPHRRVGLSRYTMHRPDLIAWAVTIGLCLLALRA